MINPSIQHLWINAMMATFQLSSLTTRQIYSSYGDPYSTWKCLANTQLHPLQMMMMILFKMLRSNLASGCKFAWCFYVFCTIFEFTQSFSMIISMTVVCKIVSLLELPPCLMMLPPHVENIAKCMVATSKPYAHWRSQWLIWCVCVDDEA